jgi:outer membrane receptor for ferrienterochelin and colicins
LNKKLNILVLLILFAPSILMAQTTIFGFDGQTGKALNIAVHLSNGKVYYSDTINKGIVTVAFTGKKEILVTSEGYQDFRNVISGDSKSKHNVGMFLNEYVISQVVVTDVHKPKTLNNTVLNISKIDSKKIESLGAVDLRDALSFENNIRMNRDNAIGSSGMTLMGVGGNNIKFLVDGVPVIGRMFGQVDLEQFNLENTQQIEVIKGPMSVIYGSNALAGTINIVTSNVSKKPRFNLSANYESDGQYNFSGTASKSFNKHYFTLTGGRMFFDGWSQNNVDRTFDWIPKEQYTGRLQYSYKKKDVRINVRSEFLRSLLLDRGIPIQPYEETAVDQKYKNKRFDNSLTYNNKIKESSIQLMLSNNYFNRTKNKYYKDLITLNETIIPRASEQDTQSFNATVFRTIYGFDKRGIETLLGFDGNYEFGTGQRIKYNKQEQFDVALFGSAEKQITSYLLTRMGMRYAYNSSYDAPLLYSIQTKFNFRKSRILKLAYGKGFRAPSLKELYLNFVDSRHEVIGNVNLLPETSHSITGSYIKYYKYKSIQFSTNIEGFYNSIENKIDMLVTGPISAQYGNIGLFRSLGGNVSQKMIYKDFRLNMSFNYTGIFNGIPEAQKNYNFSPQLVLQPTFKLKKTGTSFNVFYNYFGKLSRVYADTASTETTVREQDDYSMMDITVNQPFLKNKLRVSCGVRNILGVVNINSTEGSSGTHSSSSSFVSISPGTTYFISVKYEFKK